MPPPSPSSLFSTAILLLLTIGTANACAPQFEKELRYLDLYLGIKPENDGDLRVKPASSFVQYISSSSLLACTFDRECLWSNLPSDGLLDTSEFFFFRKNDKKSFPQQIQPGNPHPPQGSHFAVAGNTTVNPQSAVLLSAPVACQKGNGTLSFDYWLYNFAQLQVLIVKAARRRHHLQVILKPEMDCHFYQKAGHHCKVTIPTMAEPFRLAIRAFSLKDNVVGSMTLVNNITYHATICDKSPLPMVFGSSPIYTDSTRYPPLRSLSELSCDHPPQECRWANAGMTQHAAWRLGTNTERWNDIMKAEPKSSRPIGPFIFLAVDGLTPRPFARFVSDLIPCTQRPSTLSFRYWTKLGTQVEVCTIDEQNVPLSCVYLTEDDVPGPIHVDVDAYTKPFRFSFEIINFDVPSGGLVAISNLHIKGVLCSEPLPPVATTIHPDTIADKFVLTPRPYFSGVYPLSLDCDFTSDPCFQWLDEDGKMLVGTAPDDAEDFPIPEDNIRGNVAVVLLSGVDTAVIRSRDVPCAFNMQITVTYMRSEHGFLRLCALGQCADGGKQSGRVSLNLSSMRPFEVSIEMRSRATAMVVLDSISTHGDACPLKTIDQTICSSIQCQFAESMCAYETGVVRNGDTPVVLDHKNGGSVAVISSPSRRAFLASARFELLQPALLTLSVTQETYGSRLLLCPDSRAEIDACDELLGPRVLSPAQRRLQFPLGTSVKRFALVAYHDKADVFGPATFRIHSISIRTSDDYQLCF